MNRQQEISPSLLELLHTGYTEYFPISNDEIRTRFGELRAFYKNMSDREFDDLFSMVSSLCCAHEDAAFLEGIRVGAQLVMELQL